MPGHHEHLLRRLLNLVGRHEFLLLGLLFLLTFGIWGFAELADEVMEGETRELDTVILLLLRNPADLNDPIGPRWFEEMIRDISAMGGIGVLAIVVLAAVGFLLLQNKVRASVLLASAIVGGTTLSLLLKLGFDRPRPDLVAPGSYTITPSFPSGHAMMAAVTYLTLGVLLARVQPSRSLKAYILLVAIALTLLIGASRVYLGVHWPTDVLAGWMAGAVWAMGWWVIARWLQRRGRIEEDVPEENQG